MIMLQDSLLNKDESKNQHFRDGVYLTSSFIFSLVGGFYNFIKFRKTRIGFAFICLGLGFLGFLFGMTLVGIQESFY